MKTILRTYVYVCMVVTNSKSKNQPGKVANPARGQLKRENEYFPVPVLPENLVSLDEFGRPVARQLAHLYTQAESGAYLRDFSRFPRRRPFIYLNRHVLNRHCEVKCHLSEFAKT